MCVPRVGTLAASKNKSPSPCQCLQLCQQRNGMSPRFASTALIHPAYIGFRLRHRIHSLRIRCLFICPHFHPQCSWDEGPRQIPSAASTTCTQGRIEGNGSSLQSGLCHPGASGLRERLRACRMSTLLKPYPNCYQAEASVPAEAAPSPRPQIEAPGLLHLLQQHQSGLPLPALLAGAQSRIEGDDLVGTLLKSQNLWTAFDMGNIQNHPNRIGWLRFCAMDPQTPSKVELLLRCILAHSRHPCLRKQCQGLWRLRHSVRTRYLSVVCKAFNAYPA